MAIYQSVRDFVGSIFGDRTATLPSPQPSAPTTQLDDTARLQELLAPVQQRAVTFSRMKPSIFTTPEGIPREEIKRAAKKVPVPPKIEAMPIGKKPTHTEIFAKNWEKKVARRELGGKAGEYLSELTGKLKKTESATEKFFTLINALEDPKFREALKPLQRLRIIPEFKRAIIGTIQEAPTLAAQKAKDRIAEIRAEGKEDEANFLEAFRLASRPAMNALEVATAVGTLPISLAKDPKGTTVGVATYIPQYLISVWNDPMTLIERPVELALLGFGAKRFYEHSSAKISGKVVAKEFKFEPRKDFIGETKKGIAADARNYATNFLMYWRNFESQLKHEVQIGKITRFRLPAKLKNILKRPKAFIDSVVKGALEKYQPTLFTDIIKPIKNLFAEKKMPEGAITAALGTIPRAPAFALGEEAARGKITAQKPFEEKPTPQEIAEMRKLEPLMEEARKYGSAEEFVNKFDPVKFELEKAGSEKRLILDLFPKNIIKGLGITKSRTLDILKDSFKENHKIVEPSNGLWTKEGKLFIDAIEKAGYVKAIEKRGQIERFKITEKILERNNEYKLKEIWKEARAAKRILPKQPGLADRPDTDFLTEKEAGDFKAAKGALKRLQQEISGLKQGMGAFGIGKTNLGVLAEMAEAGDKSAIDLQKRTEQAQAKVNELEEKAKEGRQAEMVKEREIEEKLELARATPKVKKFYESSYWTGAKERSETEKPMTTSQKKIVLTRINISDKGKYDAKFDAAELLKLEESGKATIRPVEIPAGERVAATFALERNKEKSYKPFIFPLVQQSLKTGKTVYVDVNSGGATVVKMLPEMMNSGMNEAHLNFFDAEKFIIESLLQRHGADGVISRLRKVDTQHRRELLQNLAKSRHKNVREITGAYLKENPAGSFDADFVKWTKETTINGEKIPPPIQGSRFYRAWRDAMQVAHQKISPQVQATNIDSAVKIMYAERISVRGNQGFIGTKGLNARPKTVETLTKNLELDAEAFRTVRNQGGKVTLHSADGKKFVEKMVNTLSQKGKIGEAVFYTDPPYIRTTETYIAKQASPEEVAALGGYTSPAGLENIYKPVLKAVEEHGADLIMTNDINAGYLKMLLKYPFNSTIEVYRENTTPTSLAHTLGDNSNFSLYEVNEKFMDIEGYEPESAAAKEAIRKRAINVKKMIRQVTRQEKPSSYYEDEHGALIEFTTRELRGWYRNIEQQQTKAAVEQTRKIKDLAAEKGISDETLRRVVSAVGAREFKNITVDQAQKIEQVLKQMKKGDKLLTDKQLAGLKSFLGKESPFLTEEGLDLITQREVREKLGEKEILQGGIIRYVPQSFLPTLESKLESPVIKEIVDKADRLLRDGEKVHKARMRKFVDLLNTANKSFKRPAKERLLGINPRIFRALDVNAKVKLTPAEQKLAEFMRSELKTAADDMKLNRRRIKYVPHIEKQLMESIITDGLLNAVSKISKNRAGLPTDILLALDNIFSTEKYFKYAQQRKGGIRPTMDIGKIFDQYFQLVEKKKALDQVLPEVNMANKLLLEGNTAKWLQDFAKNLSGRKLDNKIRYGKGGWAYRGLESFVNLGYLLKLSFRSLSAAKNLIGGEVNSMIWQGFGNYAKGKARLISHPIKAHKLIDESGVTDGSFADYAKTKPSGVVTRTRQVFDIVAWGQQQGVEFQIRGSFFLGELTKEEFDTGKVSPERFREIMNGIARTQGVFTATDAPLAAQTVFGRVALQFLRWKLTNLMMIRRISKELKSSLKADPSLHSSQTILKNWNRLIFAVTTFLLALYLEKELYKAGWRKLSQAAGASGDFLGSIVDFVSGEDINNMLPDVPATSTIKEIIFSWQEVLSMTGLVEEPRKLKFSGGIENMYLAPWQQLRDFGLISNEKQDENYLKARQKIYKEEIKKLVEKGKLDLSQAEADEAIERGVLTEEQIKRMHQKVIKEEYDIESINFSRYETAEDYKKVMAIPERERDRLVATLAPKTLDALEKWEFADENPDATAAEIGIFLAGQKEESRDELFIALEKLEMREGDRKKIAKEKKVKVEIKKATVSQCYTHAKRVAMLAGADYEKIKDRPKGWKCGTQIGKYYPAKAGGIFTDDSDLFDFEDDSSLFDFSDDSGLFDFESDSSLFDFSDDSGLFDFESDSSLFDFENKKSEFNPFK